MSIAFKAPKADVEECLECSAAGFAQSKMLFRCEFCDGTWSGNPPDDAEVKRWNMAQIEKECG